MTCFVADRFTGLVRDAGAEAVVYPSAFPWADGPSGSSPLDGILDFFEESVASLETAVARFRDDPPDLLAHDLAASETARLLARTWDVPVVQLCPAMASSPDFSMTERQAREATGPPQPVAPDDPAITAFVARRQRMLARHGIDQAPLEGFGAEHGPNLVFLPKAFQIASETFDDRFAFIGPCLADAPDTGTGWHPPEGRRVVLLSLGSSHTPDQAAFLRSCVRELADSPWHVVLTLGHRVSAEELGPLPGNVEAHQWLRHAEVLRHADVFITHAGMGSVMESLAHRVPMVLVPYHIDQRVTARRAAELRLGRMLLREDHVGTLRAAVDEVAGDPQIAAAVAGMHRRIQEAGGARRGADVLESLMRRPAPSPHSRATTEVNPP